MRAKARPRDFAISFFTLGAGVTPCRPPRRRLFFLIFIPPTPPRAPTLPTSSIFQSPTSHTPRPSTAPPNPARQPQSPARSRVSPPSATRAQTPPPARSPRASARDTPRNDAPGARTRSRRRRLSQSTRAILKSRQDDSTDARRNPRPPSTSSRRGTD